MVDFSRQYIGPRIPFIKWHHVDGPCLVTSYSQSVWLSRLELVRLRFGLTSLSELDARYSMRPPVGLSVLFQAETPPSYVRPHLNGWTFVASTGRSFRLTLVDVVMLRTRLTNFYRLNNWYSTR